MDAETTCQSELEKSEVDSGILSPRCFYKHDLLLVLLKDKLHRGTLWIVAGGFGLVLFSSFFYLTFQSGFRPTVPLGEVFVGPLLAIAGIFNLLIYLLLPASMASIFNTLRANCFLLFSVCSRSSDKGGKRYLTVPTLRSVFPLLLFHWV